MYGWPWKRRSFWAGCAKWVCSVRMKAHVYVRSARVRSTWVCYHWIKTPDFMDPPNLVNSPKLCEMTISKPTFAPSTSCTIHFECLESGSNDSTRVRRLTGLLRRAHVQIFILANGSFWFQLSGFSSNLTGHHETKTAKPIWSCRSKYSNFYVKPRLPMTNEDALNRFRTFRAVKLQSVCSYSCERRHFRSDEHVIKWGKERASNFRRLGGGSFISVRLQDKNSGATDSGGPLLPLWPISCVCRYIIQPLFSMNVIFANIWGYIRVDLHWFIVSSIAIFVLSQCS
jgi:hypothetical protein